ncbi:unnamed protein product, partial [Choristocarpus tenellus]
MKSGICAGDGAVRECIAWMLDRGFAGVTPTAMATFACKSVHEDQRVGSLQMYVHHECSAEDLGPSLFPTEDVHAIAILDIRLLNQDRHVGNILVQKLASGRAGHGLRLVPIDHGFCLPHPTAIDETQFAWLNWSQAKTPLSEAFRQYVLGLDVEGELAMLGCALGDALPSPQYLLTLRIGTALLQQGVAAGLSVFDIGKLATRCRPNLPCLLEHAVDEALRRLG